MFKLFTSVQAEPLNVSVLAVVGYPPKVIDAVDVPPAPAQDSLSVFNEGALAQVPIAAPPDLTALNAPDVEL